MLRSSFSPAILFPAPLVSLPYQDLQCDTKSGGDGWTPLSYSWMQCKGFEFVPCCWIYLSHRIFIIHYEVMLNSVLKYSLHPRSSYNFCLESIYVMNCIYWFVYSGSHYSLIKINLVTVNSLWCVLKLHLKVFCWKKICIYVYQGDWSTISSFIIFNPMCWEDNSGFVNSLVVLFPFLLYGWFEQHRCRF